VLETVVFTAVYQLNEKGGKRVGEEREEDVLLPPLTKL